MHAMNDDLAAKSQLLGWASANSPPLGPDGMPAKTSVCNEIDESVKRAESIEKQMAKSKVHNYYIGIFSEYIM